MCLFQIDFHFLISEEFHFLISDESHFRNMVVWLEDQKIRFYKIEDRAALRNLNDVGKWTEAFEKVCEN